MWVGCYNKYVGKIFNVSLHEGSDDKTLLCREQYFNSHLHEETYNNKNISMQENNILIHICARKYITIKTSRCRKTIF